jgi:hypothetical protein
VRLYSAASIQREALGLAFPPAEKISYQKSLDGLHALVPQKEFDLQWNAGRALTAQAAMNFALEPATSGPRAPRKRRQTAT